MNATNAASRPSERDRRLLAAAVAVNADGTPFFTDAELEQLCAEQPGGIVTPTIPAADGEGQLETDRDRADRYERTLRAIAACDLTGLDFGDWVQAACEDVLEGLEPECYKCGTFVHDGPCVSDADVAAADQLEESTESYEASAAVHAIHHKEEL